MCNILNRGDFSNVRMPMCVLVCIMEEAQGMERVQGSHPTWKTVKTWNFVIFFSRPGKSLEIAQKVVKTWNFNSKP